MKPDERFPHYWICFECAENKGGTWPPGHCATVHTGECPYCLKKDVTVIPFVDFDWKDLDTIQWRD